MTEITEVYSPFEEDLMVDNQLIMDPEVNPLIMEPIHAISPIYGVILGIQKLDKTIKEK